MAMVDWVSAAMLATIFSHSNFYIIVVLVCVCELKLDRVFGEEKYKFVVVVTIEFEKIVSMFWLE
jgi:hypothetical protein